MIILGISDSHEAHACIVKSGRIVSAAAEERFFRIKTDCGYPSRAIEKVIEESGIKANEKEDNAEYYNIIKEFEKLSGHSVLLNTSFNLHGDAIVETADQAIATFENLDIDILLIDGKAIIRNTEV